ncbi:hypothetical protein HFN89_00960 [Rhizobium laguerreae]|nr:hypothetical protein [Rhizobium laguerreae]
MVTEYLGTAGEPTAEQRELASKKRQLVDALREETARVKESFLPVMRMHGDEVVGFVSHDEFDAVERAALEFSASKKKAAAALADSEKHHGWIGTALLLAMFASVANGLYQGGAAGCLTFVIAAACIMPFGLMKPWPDHARSKLKEIALARTLAAQRPGLRALPGFAFLLGDQPHEMSGLLSGATASRIATRTSARCTWRSRNSPLCTPTQKSAS